MLSNSLNKQVYEHLFARIYYGIYNTSEKLPSVMQLCKIFHVSLITVRNALKALEKNGYITMGRGKRAVVCYSPQPDERQEHYNTFLQSIQYATYDLENALGILCPSLFVQGAAQCEEKDFYKLSQVAFYSNSNERRAIFDFFYYLVNKLGNTLAVSLYLDAALFLFYTDREKSLSDIKKLQSALPESLKSIMNCCKKSNYRQIHQIVRDINEEGKERVKKMYSSLPIEQKTTNLSYVWNVASRRPQLCFTVAIKLYEDICLEIPNSKFLPSVQSLAQKYKIPLITMRRAIALLNDVGITETLNGKGTRMNISRQRIDFSSTHTVEILTSYLYSLQILAITGKDVVLALFDQISPDAVQKIIIQLNELHNKNRNSIAISSVKLLLNYSNNCAIKEFYGYLCGLLLWGSALYSEESVLIETEILSHILLALQTGNGNLFANELQKLLYQLFCETKEILISHGITNAEKIITPNMSLI